MSTRYDIKIIYGFWCDNPVMRDRKTGQPTYLADWLADNGYHSIGQINAGQSNGGSPDFFVGVEIVGVTDFTRSSTPFAAVPRELPRPSGEIQDQIGHAYRELSILDPGLVHDERHAVGFYLIGDAA